MTKNNSWKWLKSVMNFQEEKICSCFCRVLKWVEYPRELRIVKPQQCRQWGRSCRPSWWPGERSSQASWPLAKREWGRAIKNWSSRWDHIYIGWQAFRRLNHVECLMYNTMYYSCLLLWRNLKIFLQLLVKVVCWENGLKNHIYPLSSFTCMCQQDCFMESFVEN